MCSVAFEPDLVVVYVSFLWPTYISKNSLAVLLHSQFFWLDQLTSDLPTAQLDALFSLQIVSASVRDTFCALSERPMDLSHHVQIQQYRATYGDRHPWQWWDLSSIIFLCLRSACIDVKKRKTIREHGKRKCRRNHFLEIPLNEMSRIKHICKSHSSLSRTYLLTLWDLFDD